MNDEVTEALYLFNAAERTKDIVNIISDISVCLIDTVALKSNNRKLRRFALVITGLDIIDKARMIYVSHKRKQYCIDHADDPELAKSLSSFKNVLGNIDIERELGKIG